MDFNQKYFNNPPLFGELRALNKRSVKLTFFFVKAFLY